MWWGRENNGNVVVVIYSFTIQEDVLKKVESGVDVWSMYLWMKNIYIINGEGEIIKLWRRE